mgnify:FL=1
MTFTHKGEKWLDMWMSQNAFVTWIEYDEPWNIEEEIFRALFLPLNIKGNSHNLFCSKLKQMRKEALNKARELPNFNE